MNREHHFLFLLNKTMELKHLLLVILLVRGSALVLPTKSRNSRLESTTKLFDGLDVRYTPKDDGSGLDYAERSRPFRRDVFAYDDWVRHRSSGRFAGRLIKLFRSGIVRGTCGLASFLVRWLYG
jgi:hypothetical protein